MTERCCDTCKHFETFPGRDDEISGMGCKEPGYAGYVTEPQTPPCGGIKWTPKHNPMENHPSWCNPLSRA